MQSTKLFSCVICFWILSCPPLYGQSFLSKIKIFEDATSGVDGPGKTAIKKNDRFFRSDMDIASIGNEPVAKREQKWSSGEKKSDSKPIENPDVVLESVPSSDEMTLEVTPMEVDRDTSETAFKSVVSDKIELITTEREEVDTIDSIPKTARVHRFAYEDDPAEKRENKQPHIWQFLNRWALLEVELAIQKGRYDLALATLNRLPEEPEEALHQEQKFKILERKQYLLVRVHFLLSDFERVAGYSRVYLQQYGNGEHFHRVYYYFASALSQLEKPLEFTFLVSEDFFGNLSTREETHLREILIEDAIENDEIITAFFYLEESDNDMSQNNPTWTSLILEKLENIEDIDEVLARYKNTRFQSQLYLKKIQLLIRDGHYGEARQNLDILLESGSVKEIHYRELEELRQFTTIAMNTDPYKIGMLLPFSHRNFWVYAQQVIDGLELALQEIGTDEFPVQLTFKDSTIKYSKSQSAKIRRLEVQKQIDAKIRELVEKDKVIAVLGPLTKDASIAAGHSADRYKIPVISFSQTEDIGKDLPFLFRFFRKKTQEAEAIAHYATDYLNAKRFILFYTADRKGKGLEIVNSFETVIRSKGAQIVGSIPIRPKQVDFQDGFKSITGGFRVLSDKEKLELEKSKERFQADLDFDAVFIEGIPESLKNITSFLHLYGASHAWILTGSEINIRESQLLQHTKKLRFADVFSGSNSSSSSTLQSFQEAHWKLYNHRKIYIPPTAYTIFAYEALRILGELLSDPRYRNREFLKNTIRELHDFPVMTGTVSYHGNGDIVKSLRILQIKQRNTVDIFETGKN